MSHEINSYYVGVRTVRAYPTSKDGEPGYHVTYNHGEPGEEHGWVAEEEFEKHFIPIGPDKLSFHLPSVEKVWEENSILPTSESIALLVRLISMGVRGWNA